MPNLITESDIEQIALDILHNDLGSHLAYGPDLAEVDTVERTGSDVVLAVDCKPPSSAPTPRRSKR